jgi:hypothetical protein
MSLCNISSLLHRVWLDRGETWKPSVRIFGLRRENRALCFRNISNRDVLFYHECNEHNSYFVEITRYVWFSLRVCPDHQLRGRPDAAGGIEFNVLSVGRMWLV